MKKTRTRLLALLTVLTMLASMLPTTVWAEGEGTTGGDGSSGSVVDEVQDDTSGDDGSDSFEADADEPDDDSGTVPAGEPSTANEDDESDGSEDSTVSPVETKTVEVSTLADLEQAIADATVPTNIIVTGDIVVNKRIDITGDKDITIKSQTTPTLNEDGKTYSGVKLIRDPSYSYYKESSYAQKYLFWVKGGAKLTLSNIIVDGNRDNITTEYSEASIVVSGDSSSLTLDNGAVVQNTKSYWSIWYGSTGSTVCSAISVYDHAILNMKDGAAITNNLSTYHGGGVILSYGSTFNMEGGTVSYNVSTGTHGGGIALTYGDCVFYMAGGTIDHNSSVYQGGGVYAVEASLKITSGTISNNVTQKQYGGGISNESTTGTDYISNATFYNNQSKVYGGGIYSKTSIVLENVIFDSNTTSSYGGGLRVEKGSSSTTASLTNVTFVNNKAYRGGGLYTSAPTTLTNCVFGADDTTANYTITKNSASDSGGAIYSTSTLTMDKCVIRGNAAGDDGGGVYNSGVFTMTDSTISGNAAGGDGGGVCHIGSSYYFTMTNSTISGNTATGNGGGVYHSYGTFIINGGTIGGTLATDVNTATNGGGVYNSGATFTMNSGTIIGNTATENGGGVYSTGRYYIYSNGQTVKTYQAILGVAGGEITGNSAKNGGGVYNASVSFTNNDTAYTALGTFELSDDGTISGNTSSNNGGGVANSGTLTINGGEISNNVSNTALKDKELTAATYGGGGVYSEGTGTVTMTGGTISGNTATNSIGGGVFITGTGSFTLSKDADGNSNGTISGNSGSYGGGVFADYDTKLTIAGGTIENNTAMRNGGGICNHSFSFVMSDGTVTENSTGVSSSDNGGGIVSDGYFELQGGTISKNTSYGGAGGISILTGRDEDAERRGFSATGGTITENHAQNNVGGGLYIALDSNETCSLENVEITYNTAAKNYSGGGIYVANIANLQLTDCYIDRNSVDGGYRGGGGIYSYRATVSIDGGSVSYNTAPEGGGIYNYYGIITLNGGTITGNTATNGGGVYNDNGTITLNSGSITGNTAEQNGGGVFSYEGTLTMVGGTLCNNTASKSSGDDLGITRCTITLRSVPTGEEAWTLDEKHGGEATITGWYDDTAMHRWSAATAKKFTQTGEEVKKTGGLKAAYSMSITNVIQTEWPNDISQNVQSTFKDVVFPKDGSVSFDNSGTMLLLYKVTISGTPGVAYTLTDNKATAFVQGSTATYGTSVTGTFPESGQATYYVVGSFTTDDITTSSTLSNPATLKMEGVEASATADVNVTSDVYTITYKAESTDENPFETQQVKGILPTKTANIINNTPTKEGYVFSGWADESGKIYQPSEEIKLEGSVILTAQWDVDNWKDADNGKTPDPGTGETDPSNPDETDPSTPGSGETTPEPSETPTDSSTGSDGIADKYQVLVEFTTAGEDAHGKVGKEGDEGTLVQVFTLRDADGKTTDSGTIKPADVTPVPDTGYAFDHWEKTVTDSDGTVTTITSGVNPFTDTEVSGGTTITYTAVFEEDVVGGTDPVDPDTGTTTPIYPDGIPDKYQVEITYKIVGGTWKDGTKTDKVEYVTLTTDGTDKGAWAEDGTGKLTPPAGMKASDGYYDKSGAWSPELPADNVISKSSATEFTYSYQANGNVVYNEFKGDNANPTSATTQVPQGKTVTVVPNDGTWTVLTGSSLASNNKPTWSTTNGTTYTTTMGNDTLTINDPTRVGYTFNGWKQTTDDDENVVLVAQWKANEYKITYELNGGNSGEKAPDTHTYGVDTIISAPTKDGYVFTGWTAVDEKGNPVTLTVNDDGTVTIGGTAVTSDITLTANWEKDDWFDADNDKTPDPGTGETPTTPETDKATGGDGIADKYQVLVEFTVADKDAHGTVGKDGDKGTLVQVFTLTDEDGNTTTSGTITPVEVTPVANPGYAFDHWEKVVKDGNTTITTATNVNPFAETEVKGGTTITYTAVFEKDEVGGTKPIDPSTGKEITTPDGETTTTPIYPDGIPDKYQVKVTYKIVGGTWEDGTTTEKVEYVTLTTDGKWDVNGTGTLTLPENMKASDGYDQNSGSWSPAVPTEISGTEDRTYTYTFQEYGSVIYTASTDNGPAQDTKTVVSQGKTVTVVPDGGTWSPVKDSSSTSDTKPTWSTTDEINYTTTMGDSTLTINDPTQVGYTFEGWEKTTDDQGNVTLTATWTPNEYEIEYELDGGKLDDDAPKTHTYGEETTIPDPTKDGYTFNGWTVTDKDGNPITIKDRDGNEVTTITSLGGTDITSNVILIANWLPVITLTPQSMTAYVGGYSQNGTHAPKLRYSVDTLDEVDVDDLTFTIHTVTGSDEEITTLTAVSPDDSDYYLMSELGSLDDSTEDTTTVLRASYMKLVDTDDTSTTYAGTYQVETRTGENAAWDSWYITAEDQDGNTYSVNLNTEDVTVTIREVSDENGIYDNVDTYVTPVVNTETELATTYKSNDGAIALIPENSSYDTNGISALGVLGVDKTEDVDGYEGGTATVGLLYDDTVSLNSAISTTELEDMMLTYAEEQNNADYSDWNQEFKYLDLVNINDGNAVMTSSEAVDVYWPYPEGVTYETADNYDFLVLHYAGMNREQAVETSLDDIDGLSLESLEVTATEYGLKFTTKSFSPFVLMWKTKYTPSSGSLTPAPTTPSEDVVIPALNTENHYAYIIGMPDGYVHPDDTITRAEVATIFFRLLTDETREAYLTTENKFTDVNEDQWFNTAVSTLTAMGILKGTSDTTFEPNRAITRAELAAICARFDGGTAVSTNVFSDISGHWAESEILRAADLGWVLGYTDGTFRPNQNITRAETMTMINRVLDRVPESKEDLSADMTEWPDNMDEDKWCYLAIQEATNSHDYTNESKEVWQSITSTPDWKQYEIKK